MEFIILGLLMSHTRTLYEINKALEQNISLFYRASFGSISTALNRLLEKQWVVMEEQIERGRNKKRYMLTQAGTEAFLAWLDSPIPGEHVRDPALTRLFFLGYQAPREQIATIEAHLASLEAIAALLSMREQNATTLEIPPAQRAVAEFQLRTLRYGQAYYAFSLAWYRRLLAELQEQIHED